MRVITYSYQKKDYRVGIDFPYTSNNAAVVINNVICGYPKTTDLLEDMDNCLHRAIKRYEAEKALGLITKFF